MSSSLPAAIIPAAEQELARRIAVIGERATAASDAHAAISAMVRTVAGRYDAARLHRDHTERAMASVTTRPADADATIARAAEPVARAKAALEAAQAKSKADSRKVWHARQLAVRMEHFLAGRVLSAFGVLPVKVPKGANLQSVRAEIAALEAEELVESKAIPPLEIRLAELRAEVDRLAEAGRPRATGLAAWKGRAGVGWPLRATGGAPGDHGGVPNAIDAAAVGCWIARDAVIAELEAQARAFYAAHAGPVLDSAEKARRAAERKVKILALERIEGALIWLEIDAGREVEIRREMSISALLGVEK